MRRALVLDAGSSWAAFQVGALHHLVADRGMQFDLHVGTGIGAMHAAFVACGEVEALTVEWSSMGLRRLVRPNVRRSWRDGPLRASPQRRFLAAHLSEARLAARGVTLAASVVDLRTGELDLLVWPGCDVPLVDGVLAAVATPGLLAPLRHGGRELAEATVVDAVPLRFVLGGAPPSVGVVDEVVAVLAGPPVTGGPRRRFDTWRSVGTRALAMNLAHDVDAALDTAARSAAAAAAFDEADRKLAAAVDALVGDDALRRRLLAEIARRRSASPHPRPRAPRLHVVRPARPVDVPLWRFRQGDLDEWYLDGHARARSAMDGVDVALGADAARGRP